MPREVTKQPHHFSVVAGHFVAGRIEDNAWPTRVTFSSAAYSRPGEEMYQFPAAAAAAGAEAATF